MNDGRDIGDQPGVVAEASALLDHATDLKDEAYERGELALLERAISEYDEVHRRFGRDDPGEALEMILAMATYNRSGALWSLGRLDEATAGFAELADSYAEHPEERLREVGQFSALRRGLMISIPEPPTYLRDEMQLETEPDVSAQFAHTVEREAVAGAMLNSHEQAAAILHRFRGTGCPFVLFLRSFEIEAFELMTGGDWTAETGLGPHSVSFSSTTPSSAERQLFAFFGDEPAVISVANHASQLSSAWVIPRLFLPDEGWEEVLGVLIRAASAIAMQVTAFTPGVRWEIEQIRAHGDPRRTLLICGNDRDDDLDIKPVLERFAGRPRSQRTPARVDDPQLAEFPYVVAWPDVPAAGVTTLEPLSQLLPAVHDILGMDAESRLRFLVDAAFP